MNLVYKDISLTEEAAGCLLCHHAPCSKACPYGLDPDRIIRSVRMRNERGAANSMPDILPCLSCEAKPCLQACLKAKMNRPVKIDEIMRILLGCEKAKTEDVDLSIDFCGVHCENPFFLSSSVVGSNYEMVAKAFDMGWSGVAFKTIGTFVAKEVSPRFDQLNKEALPFIGFKNIEQISEHTLEENIRYLRDLKNNYPTKIIVASIMGKDEDEWTYLARLMTQAGADILECNFSCPHMVADACLYGQPW